MTADRPSRTEKTRAALVAAGRKLFCEHPIDAVAIDDIVREAGVAKGSFYNHFTDREALARAVTALIRADVEHVIDAANMGVEDSARRMVRALCVYLRYAVDDPQGAGVIIRFHTGQALEAPLNRGVVSDVTAGLASGRFALASMESGLIYVIGVVQAAFVRVAGDPNLAHAVTLAQQIGALELKGLGVPGPEAESLAAQAADEIVRQGAFALVRQSAFRSADAA
jgi:AcrR family transcriptional regulator